MEEKHPKTWASITHDLKAAALSPQQRPELISRALQHLLASLSAAGTALVWPYQQSKVSWKVYYAGTRHNVMYRWLSARLDPSLDVTCAVLQHDLPGLSDMPAPLFIRLHPLPSSPGGLWIIWDTPTTAHCATPPPTGETSECIERVQRMLEALLEVEDREEQYFSASSPVHDRELIQALAHGDTQAMAALLSLTRIAGKADFTFWAKAYQDVVEIAGHMGAIHSGFGFALPLGRGVGGRVAAYGTTIERGDYLNSPYRDPSVSAIVDSEQIRSGMALPIRYTTMPDKSAHVAAVLYATRRTVAPFSLAERLLVQRIARQIEPLPFEIRPSSFSLPPVEQLPAQKTAWYDILLHANRVETLEAWVSQYIKGTFIVTDSDGKPFVFAHAEQLEQLRAARGSQTGAVQVLSLAAPGIAHSGQAYLCPSFPLPAAQWPEFFADLVIACNLVIARMEQAQHHVGRQREQWLRMLLKGNVSQHVEQEGYRLGLPIEHGQIWVLAWSLEAMQAQKLGRKRMIAESVVLDNLKSPLIFFDDALAVVLLEGQAPQKPSKVRDDLLKYCGPCPLWIVHGGRYHALSDLHMTLMHTISLAQKARHEAYAQYLLDIYTFGLDSLLENPRLTEDLNAFARKLLTPLIEHDAVNGSHLTETFVLAETLGSAQAAAERLSVHVNTIRYRLHRAQDILGTDPAVSKEQTAMSLAAFIWQRFHLTAPDQHII